MHLILQYMRFGVGPLTFWVKKWRFMPYLLIAVMGLLTQVTASAQLQSGCVDLLPGGDSRWDWVDTLVEDRLAETDKLFGELVKKYPIEKTEFVMVGRSPSLLQAYIEVQQAMFPAIKSWVLPVSLTSESEVSMQVSRQRFLELFYGFRGGNKSFDRKIVFVDFVSEGRTFAALERILLSVGIEAELLGFTSNLDVVRNILKNKLQRVSVELIPIPLDMELGIGEHKRIAPYRSHKIEYSDYESGVIDPTQLNQAFLEAKISIQQELFY